MLSGQSTDPPNIRYLLILHYLLQGPGHYNMCVLMYMYICMYDDNILYISINVGI